MSSDIFDALEGLSRLPSSEPDDSVSAVFNDSADTIFNDSQSSTLFNDIFSQILGESQSQPQSQTQPQPATTSQARSERRKRRLLALQSLKLATSLTTALLHDSDSQSKTALRAFIRHLHNERRKRVRSDLMWPAHPDDFPHNRLIQQSQPGCEAINRQPLLAFSPSERLDKDDNEQIINVDGKGPDFRVSTVSNFSLLPPGPASAAHQRHELAQLSQSLQLHEALERTVRSIWRVRFPSLARQGECQPRLSYAIARRCAAMLEALLEQVILTRRCALRIIKERKNNTPGVENIENVPSNWEAVKAALKRLKGQAAIDDQVEEIFLKRTSVLSNRDDDDDDM